MYGVSCGKEVKKGNVCVSVREGKVMCVWFDVRKRKRKKMCVYEKEREKGLCVCNCVLV